MDSHWKHCLADYLRSLRSPATRTSYATILIRFFSQHDPCSVTKRSVENFMHVHFPDPHRTTQGELAAATQNQRVGAITSLYKFASSYIPEGETEPLWQRANPTSGIVRGKAERSPKGLTLEELSRLFSVISDVTEIGLRDRAALSLTFWCARRRSEVSNLVYGDIIETAFPHEHGGMRQCFALAFRGKGKREIRDLQEIPSHAMDAITWYLEATGRAESIRPEDPLFVVYVRSKEKPLSGDMLAKRLAIYSRQSGVKASMHTLRHTAARARHAAGASVQEVQHLLRHSTIGTTDLYLRTLIGVEDKTAKLLESQLGDL